MRVYAFSLIKRLRLLSVGVLVFAGVGFAQVGPSGAPSMEFSVGNATVSLVVPASPYAFSDCLEVLQGAWDDEWDLANGSEWIMSANTPWGWEVACFALPPGVAWNQAIEPLPYFELYSDWPLGAQFIWNPDPVVTDIIARGLVVKTPARQYVLIGGSPPEPADVKVLEPYLTAVFNLALDLVFIHEVDLELVSGDCTVGYEVGSWRVSEYPLAPMRSCSVSVSRVDGVDSVELVVQVTLSDGVTFEF